MIWVTWRQQRLQIISTFAVVAVISAVLAYIRSDALSLAGEQLVSDKYNMFLQYFVLLMLALPALLGMFAGAPLIAREIEQGTHVFGLTQSVSRTRWLVTKLAMAGGSLALAMFVLGLVSAWALRPLNALIQGRMVAPLFEIQGLAVGAYAVLAFAVGATAGLLLRNTLAAMVVTLAVYVLLLMSVANEVRPMYAEPNYYQAPIAGERGRVMLEPRYSWLVEYGYLDANGNEMSFEPSDCARGPESYQECLRSKGAVAQYSRAHLPDRFWRFQFTELGVFLLLSAGVLGAGAWASRRRLA